MTNKHMAKKGGYHGINLPDGLIAEIDKIINDKKHGYISRAEFVKEALREQIKHYKVEKP